MALEMALEYRRKMPIPFFDKCSDSLSGMEGGETFQGPLGHALSREMQGSISG